VGSGVGQSMERSGDRSEEFSVSCVAKWALSIPPKFNVAYTVGFLKGKSSVRIHREFLGQKRNFTGLHSRPRGIR
jgi:hypothetical protein